MCSFVDADESLSNTLLYSYSSGIFKLSVVSEKGDLRFVRFLADKFACFKVGMIDFCR